MEIKVDSEITLKQISRIYAEELYNLVKRNINTNLCYWCPDLKTTYSDLTSTIAHIDDANSKFSEDKTPDLLIFYHNTLAGLISLSPIYEQRSEIGYWLGGEFENKGLVSRSFPFILDYAKNNIKLKGVDLSTSVPNGQSQKLPTKFGFQKTRIIKDVERIKDKPVDHILWSLNF
jgi:ribosomal-protein-serine acetyltransferase